MASKSIRKPVARKSTKPAAKSTVAKKATAARREPVKLSPRAVYLAGLGAATRAQQQAVEAVSKLAEQAGRVSGITSETAQEFAKKATAMVKETVREGQKLQTQAYALAQERARSTSDEIAAFAKKQQKSFQKNVTKTTKAVKANVETMKSNAAQGVANLEQVFETRVAKTLNTFGVPSAHDVRELQARMADLQKALNQLQRSRLAV